LNPKADTPTPPAKVALMKVLRETSIVIAIASLERILDESEIEPQIKSGCDGFDNSVGKIEFVFRQ
jgi:hypothetical protein